MDTLKEKIVSLKTANPDWGYRRISTILDCAINSVRYHLDADNRKERIRYKVAKQIQSTESIKDVFGGKCCVCDYARSYKALEFHHLESCKKEGNVNRILKSRGYAAAMEEAEKCLLVCANCHREIHGGEILVEYDASPADAE